MRGEITGVCVTERQSDRRHVAPVNTYIMRLTPAFLGDHTAQTVISLDEILFLTPTSPPSDSLCFLLLKIITAAVCIGKVLHDECDQLNKEK